MAVDFRVAVGSGSRATEVGARLYEAAGTPIAWLVLAPGAGAGHDHRFMVAFGHGLASRGLHVVTFNFPYVERGRRVPDPNETLEACWIAVLAAVAERAGPRARLFAGGKSMGGRIASQVAARGDSDVTQGSPLVARGSASVARRSASVAQGSSLAIRGLVFLGYPLHPPGRPDQRRTKHWPAIRVPALFVQGARDPFASPEELRADLPTFGGETTLFVVEGGNHSLDVPRSGGRGQAEVDGEVQDAIVRWVRGVSGQV